MIQAVAVHARSESTRFERADQQKVFLPPQTGRTGFVYKLPNNKGFRFCENAVGQPCSTDAVATAVFTVGLDRRGWDELTLTTAAGYSDMDQAYAAGYLEGSMTWERIHSFYLAWVKNKYRREPARRAKIFEFIKTQDKFLSGKIAEYALKPASDNSAETQYWRTVALVRQQLLGMRDGYNARVAAQNATPLTLNEFWILNDDGDIFDIERLVNRNGPVTALLRENVPGVSFAESTSELSSDADTPLSRKLVSEMNRVELTEFVELSGRCTALIKRTDNDLIVAHSTWSDYREMLRIYKHYNFNYAGTHNKAISHSSYPGMIASSDDFYILGSGLVVTETTITILNEALYKHANPAVTVPAVVRSLVANYQAKDAQSWADIFSLHNSGTYNNQWMLVDMNKFEPSKALAPGTFIVLEQIPGKIVSRDMSADLDRNTYWGSYNRPYFKEINALSMFQKYSAIHGEEFSYQNAPRGKILKRDHVRVTDAQTALNLLRENNYKTDPLSQGCPYNALASRFDLPAAPSCPTKLPQLRAYGAVDVKVTSFAMHKERSALVVAGPTASASVPQFQWSKANPAIARLHPPALPDTTLFEPAVITPTVTPSLTETSAETVETPALSETTSTVEELLEVDAEGETEVDTEAEAEADTEAETEVEAEAETEAEELEEAF